MTIRDLLIDCQWPTRVNLVFGCIIVINNMFICRVTCITAKDDALIVYTTRPDVLELVWMCGSANWVGLLNDSSGQRSREPVTVEFVGR